MWTKETIIKSTYKDLNLIVEVEKNDATVEIIVFDDTNNIIGSIKLLREKWSLVEKILEMELHDN